MLLITEWSGENFSWRLHLSKDMGKKSDIELCKDLGQNHIGMCKGPVAGIGVFKDCRKASGVGG